MKQVRKGKIVAMVGFLGLFAGVLLSACSKPTEEDTSLSKVEEAKTLVVATSGTLYPSSYYNDENELVGYDVDVAKEVAKRLGVEITFKYFFQSNRKHCFFV